MLRPPTPPDHLHTWSHHAAPLSQLIYSRHSGHSRIPADHYLHRYNQFAPDVKEYGSGRCSKTVA
ncbi:MAG: hypothetical protein R2845_11070 [Thermomicrobiales bacterium]